MQILAKKELNAIRYWISPRPGGVEEGVRQEPHGTETRRGCRTLLTAPRISRTPAFALFFALCHSVDGPSSTGCFMLRSIFNPLLSTARSSNPCRMPVQQAPSRYLYESANIYHFRFSVAPPTFTAYPSFRRGLHSMKGNISMK